MLYLSNATLNCIRPKKGTPSETVNSATLNELYNFHNPKYRALYNEKRILNHEIFDRANISFLYKFVPLETLSDMMQSCTLVTCNVGHLQFRYWYTNVR